MTPLAQFWPDEQAVSSVMKTDAESASAAVVLAVHQPMRFRKRRIGAGNDDGSWVDEREVLNALLADSSDGRVILPIVGSSGTGKSHVVRWLDIQLAARPDRSKREVIRIRKGRSLKGVLQDILERVPGKQYEPYRKKLQEARERIDPERAAGLLCEMLAQSVEEIAHSASQREQQSEETQLQRTLGGRQFLPTLLRNQQLRDLHFVDRPGVPLGGVLRRLVAQLYEERVGQTVDDRDRQFEPDDLQFSDSLDRAALGRDVVRAMEQVERRRGPACALLNAALDAATRELLGLNPTVTDLFLKVREQLFQDGKELVLLVEDFAVLSGLQGQLLQVMIEGAFRDGKQVLCTMRAALAYTPGYMQTATVLTRAGLEFRIPDEDDNEEVTHTRIRRLAAAYLNAARIGQAELEAALEKAGDASDGHTWLPPVPEPEDDDALRAYRGFGREGNISLFPFNSDAIRALAHEGCRRSDNKLVYNPRFVINEVLLRVLRQRSAFLSGTFPDASFRPTTSTVFASKPILGWVEQQVTRSAGARYVAFLSYWATTVEHPGSLGPLLETVGRAFQLPPVSMPQRVAAVSPATRTPQIPTSLPAAAPQPKEVPPTATQPNVPSTYETPWRARLESWRQGAVLSPEHSRQLRKDLIGALLTNSIDWDWYALRPDFDAQGQWWTTIRIDGTESNDVADPSVVVATKEDRTHQVAGARLARELTAVAIANEQKGNWDFEGAEDEVVACCAFIERAGPEARRYLISRPLGREWSPVPRIVSALFLGAFALGKSAPELKDLPGTVEGLFDECDIVDKPTDDADGWQRARWALSAIRRVDAIAKGLPSWRSILLEQVGARQGGAAGVWAIDVSKLKESIEVASKSWSLDLNDPRFPTSLAQRPMARALFDSTVVEALRRLDRSAEAERLRIGKWSASWRENMGEESLAAALDAISKAVDALESIGTTLSHPEARKLKTLVERVRSPSTTATIKAAKALDSELRGGALLSALAAVSQESMSTCSELIEYADEVLRRKSLELKDQLQSIGNPLKEAQTAFASELSLLASLLEDKSA